LHGGVGVVTVVAAACDRVMTVMVCIHRDGTDGEASRIGLVALLRRRARHRRRRGKTPLRIRARGARHAAFGPVAEDAVGAIAVGMTGGRGVAVYIGLRCLRYERIASIVCRIRSR
ncbi:MAG: hypothetical protein ACXVJT_19140, partial [Thermoanaerobaculia bacterium]